MPFLRHVLSLLLVYFLPPAFAGGMMRRDTPPSGLRAELEKVLSGDPAQRLFVVENILRSTFEAFPKNSAGKISLQSLHSMARGYFAEEHGWLFTGFEFTGQRSTKLWEAKLLKEKAQTLVTSFEAAVSQGEGLSLSDTVAAVAGVEHLVLQESVPWLERAYALNSVSATASVKQDVLEEILSSYLLLFRTPTSVKSNDPEQHKKAKATHQADEEDTKKSSSFYRESIEGYGSRTEYEMVDAKAIVQDMALRYGKWQNSECEDMKQALLKLDPDHSGRVPLDVFHAQPQTPLYSFSESAAYLREINSLDESHAGTPKVMIANYLASPSNCIAGSQFFSVCCLNECESLVNVLEGRLKTSDPLVEKLLEEVAGISSASITAPRELSPRLVKMANAIAGVHAGVVPLQSGDFGRWFHFAFPNECHYPTDVEAQVAEGERDATERFAFGLAADDRQET